MYVIRTAWIGPSEFRKLLFCLCVVSLSRGLFAALKNLANNIYRNYCYTLLKLESLVDCFYFKLFMQRCGTIYVFWKRGHAKKANESDSNKQSVFHFYIHFLHPLPPSLFLCPFFVFITINCRFTSYCKQKKSLTLNVFCLDEMEIDFRGFIVIVVASKPRRYTAPPKCISNLWILMQIHRST